MLNLTFGAKLVNQPRSPLLAGIPVEGKSSECLIGMKYRIIILIIIIISLGQILIVYGKHITHAHTHACLRARAHTRAHARIHARAHTRARTHSRRRRHRPPHRLSLFGVTKPSVTVRSACDNADRWLFK